MKENKNKQTSNVMDFQIGNLITHAVVHNSDWSCLYEIVWVSIIDKNKETTKKFAFSGRVGLLDGAKHTFCSSMGVKSSDLSAV